MILDTTTLAYAENVDKCRQHGGILPEPRSQEDIEFLSGLDYGAFLLGMNDKETEGTWVWDSDSTPVLYQNWQVNNLKEPRYNTDSNCAVNYRKAYWRDISCLSEAWIEAWNKILICQKTEGLYFSLFFIFTFYYFGNRTSLHSDYLYIGPPMLTVLK